MPKITTKRRKLLIQFAEYMISGGAYFWSGYLIFALTWSELHWSLWWAKLSANIFGWTVNFMLQRYWVFRNPHLKDKLAQTTTRYIIITLVDFVMDYFIVYGLKKYLSLTPYLGQFVSAGFFTIWNYIWYKYWVFPERIPAPHHPARKHARPHHLQTKK